MITETDSNVTDRLDGGGGFAHAYTYRTALMCRRCPHELRFWCLHL